MKQTALRTLLAAAFGSNLVALVAVSTAFAAETPAAAPAPVAAKAGKAALTPENTRLQFVCAHRGPKPEPRTGTFAKFTGVAEVDTQSKSIKSLSLDIDTNSVTTEFGKLTSHLKSPDFFDTREHPKASFISKKVVPGDKAGQFTVTGDLTLHGVTKEIKAPVTASFTNSGFTVTSDFAIDRSEFGMNYGSDKVENTVALTFVIGEKNKVLGEGGK